MTVALSPSDVDALAEAVGALREWQRDGAPVQLHPGDLGWHQSFGAETTAAATRTWRRDGRLVAIGLLDGPDVVRLAIAPAAEDDSELAERMVLDLTQPERGVLPSGGASVEVRSGEMLRRLLREAGWEDGERWTPLSRDLTEPPEDSGLRIEQVRPDRSAGWIDVLRASFDRSTFTAERWRAMVTGPAFADARCLLGYDHDGTPVAVAAVWSAGPGRPGLLEPVGAHRDHRGHGYGRAITLAAASALRELGSSSAVVCTPAANTAAVGAYRSAGFRQLPDVPDLHRAA